MLLYTNSPCLFTAISGHAEKRSVNFSSTDPCMLIRKKCWCALMNHASFSPTHDNLSRGETSVGKEATMIGFSYNLYAGGGCRASAAILYNNVCVSIALKSPISIVSSFPSTSFPIKDGIWASRSVRTSLYSINLDV